MSTPAGEPGPPVAPGSETALQRRARLDRVFGDVLPETTRDERGDDGAWAVDDDDQLRRDVPPHHG